MIFNTQNCTLLKFSAWGLFLKSVFSKFRKFQPRCCYETYSYKKECIWSTYRVPFIFFIMTKPARTLISRNKTLITRKIMLRFSKVSETIRIEKVIIHWYFLWDLIRLMIIIREWFSPRGFSWKYSLARWRQGEAGLWGGGGGALEKTYVEKSLLSFPTLSYWPERPHPTPHLEKMFHCPCCIMCRGATD